MVNRAIQRIRDVLLLLAVIGFASACGEYGGGVPAATGPTGTLNVVPTGLSSTEQVAAFGTTVYPVVRTYCANGCHDSAGTPFSFAHPDPGTAYTVITEAQKVNLGSPSQSAVVRKPLSFHNCGGMCVEIASEMLLGVETWAAIVEASAGSSSQVSVEGIASAEQAYTDGVEQENGERYDDNLIAFWDFKEGSGEWARDLSGVEPALDLELIDAEWMSSYGVQLADGRLRGDPDADYKLYDEIAKPGFGSGQYTVELWVNNENITQENARVFTYERSSGDRNVSLMQQAYQYEFRNRSIADGSGSDGRLELLTYDVDQDAQETLQHVVLTYDLVNGRRIFVDSVFTDDEDELAGARLWNWNAGAELGFGSKPGSQSGNWRGSLRMAAIYRQALTSEQIRKNYLAGVGKRIRLSFGVGAWTGDDAQVEFSVTELDSHSYLFCQPTFVGSNLNGLRMKNLQIVVNPDETTAPAPEGQAFSNLDVLMTGTTHQVSRQCTIVRQVDGPLQDSFALVFEELGQFADPESATTLAYVPSDATLPLPPANGVRSFDRINASMAALTGVDPASGVVAPVFTSIQEQLPSSVDARTFVSSHQVALTKLSLEYCSEMVDDDLLRARAFGSEFETGSPSFFDSDVATAFGNPTLTTLLTQRLTDHLMGTRQLAGQPLRADVVADLDQLMLELVSDCGPCDTERTRNIAKGLCAALLAGAPVMVH